MDLSSFMHDRVLRKEKSKLEKCRRLRNSKGMVLVIVVLVIIGFEEIARIGVEGC